MNGITLYPQRYEDCIHFGMRTFTQKRILSLSMRDFAGFYTSQDKRLAAAGRGAKDLTGQAQGGMPGVKLVVYDGSIIVKMVITLLQLQGH